MRLCELPTLTTVLHLPEGVNMSGKSDHLAINKSRLHWGDLETTILARLKVATPLLDVHCRPVIRYQVYVQASDCI